MSILIKGMEMPKNCFNCPCYHRKVDDGYYDYEICRANGTVFNDGYSSVTGHKDHIDPFKQRLDNCPLVPVPPHGRLIDGDAVFKRLQKQAMSVWGNGNPRYQIVLEVMDAIRFAPTIIPAEEGEA